MATGRTTVKHTRVYVNGFDLSGNARTIGPLEQRYDEAELTAMADTVKGYLPNHPQINVGTLNAVFDNTATTGIHAVLGTAGNIRTVLVAMGIRAAPADGDPCFGGQFTQGAYQVAGSGGSVLVNVPFQGWAADATTLRYGNPWGTLLHANAARTAVSGVNTALGYDNPTGAQSLKGGYLLYHVTAGNGTATLSVDDAAANTVDGDFSPLVAATTGELDCAVKQYGIVPLSTAAVVRRYIRWQIAFNTATTVSFALAFMRKY